MLGFLLLIAVATALVLLVLTIIIAYDATHPVRRTGAYAAARGLPFDPGDLGYEFESWTLDRPDGATLPVWEVCLKANEDGGIEEVREAGERLTIVFIHGWGESRIDMLPMLEACRRYASRAAFFDLRGHGEATFTSRLGNREDDDLLALLERLGRSDRFVLIGRDLGANIAIAAAAKESPLRARITGILAISAYDNFHARWQQRLRARDFPSRPITDLALMWFNATGRTPLVVDEGIASRLDCLLLRTDEWDDRAARDFLAKARSASRRI